YLFLIIPIIFFSVFHYSNSIYQAYNLVDKGSRYASYYKSIVSVLFTISVLFFFFFIEDKENAIIYCIYPLSFLGLVYLIKEFRFKKIWKSFQIIIQTV